MTTQRITIRRPADPLASEINSRRSRYARKWLIPAPSAAKDEERAVLAAVAERESKLASDILSAFAANGYGVK